MDGIMYNVRWHSHGRLESASRVG